MPACTFQAVVVSYATARLAEIAVLLVALHGLLLLLTDCCTQSMPMSDSVSDIGHPKNSQSQLCNKSCGMLGHLRVMALPPCTVHMPCGMRLLTLSTGGV